MEETGLSSITKTLTNAFSSNPPSAIEPIEPISNSYGDATDMSNTESGYSIWSVISGILIVLIIWVLIFNLFSGLIKKPKLELNLVNGLFINVPFLSLIQEL